jgi:hypothetical protein
VPNPVGSMFLLVISHRMSILHPSIDSTGSNAPR